ncbi:MAG TPA: hypothetical protein VLE91_01755 [Candidatus Saccharimonadales bacterium]|nr:hypothetical protein [Candidatus Saccharimonadales bacterium]
MKNAKKILTVAAFLIMPLVLSACSTPAPVSIGGISAPPDVEEFTKGSLVKGFPANLPLYPGATVVESYSNKDAFGASFTTSDDFSKVVAFYNKLPQLGWDSQLKQVSATNYAYDIKGGTLAGTIIVNTAADGKTTAITIAVANR